jgi:hypothetical protein
MAYTTITDPSAYFQAQLYTGNGGTNNIVNGGNSNLQPDWVWTKERNGTNWPSMYDSSRGVTKQISSNVNNSQYNGISGVTAFNTDGYTLGSATNENTNNNTYVSWQWKANGGTTASNASGSITSTTQANTTAGYSIVTYTGNGVNGATVGHSLGVVPQMIIIKRLDAAANWQVYHEAMGPTKAMFLDLVSAADTDATYWSNTAPTTGIFNLGTNTKGNASGGTYVAYCFTSIQGYSKFGGYNGNSNADGVFVYTGFRPAFLMVKNISAGQSWWMWDDKRIGYNAKNYRLRADQDTAEDADSKVDFVSNGFKFRDGDNAWNYSGNDFLYMAFARNPFVATNGVPTTAR